MTIIYHHAILYFLLKLTVKKGEFMLDELNVTRKKKDFNKWVPDAW